MALSRRTGQRFQASIWPGFVDAMTGLLLVLMFVLTIFMIVQFVLRETISGQESELNALSAEVSALARALGLEEQRAGELEDRVGALSATLTDARSELAQQSALISSLQIERAEQDAALAQAETQITSFEAQVAALLADQERALGAIADLEAQRDTLISEQEALNFALAQTRSEIDAQTEAARLAAARREALEAMVADLQSEQAEAQTRIGDLETQLSAEEAARIADAAAAQALRERLENADAELTAMTLALEAQRQEAEDTLTLLAAAEAARDELDARLLAALSAADENAEGLAAAQADQEVLRDRLIAALAEREAAQAEATEQLSLAEQRAALLAAANTALSREEATSAEAQRQVALLNQQVAALRTQLGSLQALLDDAKVRDAAAQVQLETLGSDLNAALARAAAEERRRRQLEEAERIRLEEEAAQLAAEAENLAAQAEDLARYRSEFFGRLREVLSGQDRVRIVGDRFVFSSEVLFDPASAVLSTSGRAEIESIAGLLREIAEDIPEDIDWLIRVDGHTDNLPLSGFGAFADNWELSQARALSVVRYMVSELGIPPNRLAANGFGEYQPLNPEDTDEARAQNRRIELKLTER